MSTKKITGDKDHKKSKKIQHASHKSVKEASRKAIEQYAKAIKELAKR